jgi:threonine aldolase
MYGGGMRQAGILAAGGLYAVEHHRARLGEDHANAKAMADALAGAGVKGMHVEVSRVHTNIVMIDLDTKTVADVVAKAKAKGVLLGSGGAKRIRAVTHLDVTRDAVLRAATVIAECVSA